MSWDLLKYKWAQKIFWNSLKRLLLWSFFAWIGLFWIVDLPGWWLDLIFPTLVVGGVLIGFIYKKIFKKILKSKR